MLKLLKPYSKSKRKILELKKRSWNGNVQSIMKKNSTYKSIREFQEVSGWNDNRIQYLIDEGILVIEYGN